MRSESSGLSLGRRLLASPQEAMWAEEQRDGPNSDFAAIDSLVDRLLRRFLSGDALVRQVSGRIEVVLGSEDRDFVSNHYSLQVQRARGAWHIPDDLKIGAGILNLASNLRLHPRYSMTLAQDQTNKVSSASSSDHVLLWSTIEPTIRHLIEPIAIRSYSLKTKPRQDIATALAASCNSMKCLSTNGDYVIQIVDMDSDWESCNAAERMRRRVAFLRRLKESLREDAASRIRLVLIRNLVERYYSRSKKGPATQTQVMNESMAAPLSAYFGGDWMAFLRYIDEPPHPEERIISALPESRILIETSRQPIEIAEKLGISEDKVAEVLAKFWNTSTPAAPVERRVRVMRQFWEEFQAIHDRQKPGMTPLWGLVSEYDHEENLGNTGIPYTPGLFKRLLSGGVNTSINELWSRYVFKELPDVSTTSAIPNKVFGTALGPALRFWHGCSLTAWFLCEGPYSRTDMAGLEHYHRRELAQLNELGCPIAASLFSDLIEAERGLGPPKGNREESQSGMTVDNAIQITMTVGFSNSKRKGFQRLREVISHHRRKWSETHFDDYLMKLATHEVQCFASQHAQHLARTGKAPSLKSLINVAKPAADHWFGGDIRLLYAAIGEPIKEALCFVPDMPGDVQGYRYRVYAILVGRGRTATYEEILSQDARFKPLKALSNRSIDLLRIKAILGRDPTPEEFDRREFDKVQSLLGDSTAVAWRIFVDACDQAR